MSDAFPWWRSIPVAGNEELIAQLDAEYQSKLDRESYINMFPNEQWVELVEQYPEEYRIGLRDFINATMVRDEYYGTDNHRIADTESEDDMAMYQLLRDTGCCGFFDENVTINNKTFRVGFNFGH